MRNVSLWAAVAALAAPLFLSGPAFAADQIPADVLKAAQAEGRVDSVGMPDTWANWVGTWSDLKTKFGIEHSDTDMSSGQEIAKFEAEKNAATADIGDVGVSFGPIAKQRGVTQPNKGPVWNEIPAWAKDPDGHWTVGYTGTICFLIDKSVVKEPYPMSWADLLKGDYKLTTGDVSVAAQAVSGVLACAYANGGDEKNLKPALDFFAKLAKAGRLNLNDPTLANIEKGEVEVAIMWDFNALNYRSQIDPKRFEVIVPKDGTLMSGYCTIINKYAKHPNAARLAQDYILSDEGQINLAEGFARPIRKVALPEEVKAKMLPDEQYAAARPVKDADAWDKSAKRLPRQWQENVMVHMQ